MKEKENYIAFARVICAFAVVMIHTNTCFNEFNVEYCWSLANFIDCSLGFAVPIFIMISGATLLDYRERYSTIEFLLRRIKKVLIPFVIWGIVAMIYIDITNRVGIFFVYLFFGHLFLVYLSIPIFSLVKKEYREKAYGILIVLLFVLNYLFPSLNNYLFYMLSGYLIAKTTTTLRIRLITYILALIGLIVHVFGTYMMSVQTCEIVHLFRGYTNLPCTLTAIGVFVFIKQIGQKCVNEKIINFINKLSGYTFAIYLIHLYVIQLIIEPIFKNTHAGLYKLGTPFITFTLCIMFTWGLRRIPILRKCLP